MPPLTLSLSPQAGRGQCRGDRNAVPESENPRPHASSLSEDASLRYRNSYPSSSEGQSTRDPAVACEPRGKQRIEREQGLRARGSLFVGRLVDGPMSTAAALAVRSIRRSLRRETPSAQASCPSEKVCPRDQTTAAA
jgi:hypothetical protein